MLNDFFNLIFPRLCNACNEVLLKHEKTICSSCLIGLPKTKYHLEENNPIEKIFWGRANVIRATSFYTFSKGGKVQQLLHNMKYKGVKDVGIKIGEECGWELKKANFFENIDFIVPVPLHKNKLKTRGYNQSNFFALGLSKSTDIPINNNLYRVVDTKTQTKRTRYNRWENVEGIFSLKKDSVIANKTIMLVDDVITTGATMEAAIQVLTEQNCKVYVVTMACVKN